MVFGKHAHKDMEMVIHKAKAWNLGEVNLREGFQAGKEIVFVPLIIPSSHIDSFITRYSIDRYNPTTVIT